LNDEPQREHARPQCARPGVSAGQVPVVPPRHALPGDQADEHPEQRPTHKDGDQEGQPVPEIDQQARQEDVFGPSGSSREECGYAHTEESGQDVLQGIAPQQANGREHHSSGDGYPQRSHEVPAEGRIDHREQCQREAGIEECAGPERGPQSEAFVRGDGGEETWSGFGHAALAGSRT
jgi:hypothetical protein